MSKTIRLTTAPAMMRWLSVQMAEGGARFIEGVRAIFGHGDVARVGEELHRIGVAIDAEATLERIDAALGQLRFTAADAALRPCRDRRRNRRRDIPTVIVIDTDAAPVLHVGGPERLAQTRASPRERSVLARAQLAHGFGRMISIVTRRDRTLP